MGRTVIVVAVARLALAAAGVIPRSVGAGGPELAWPGLLGPFKLPLSTFSVPTAVGLQSSVPGLRVGVTCESTETSSALLPDTAQRAWLVPKR